MKQYPFVVASTDGEVALEISEFRSVDPVENRDAKSYSFLVRTEPNQEIRLLRVLFSGTVLMFPREALGVPVYKDRQTTFEVAAVAAVGDYLDEKGILPTGGPEDSVLTIKCFSDGFDTLRERPSASDAVVESYLRSHLYWAWKFGHENWSAGMPDRIRLNLPISGIDRMVSPYNGETWEVIGRDGDSISLKPTSGFLRDERQRRETEGELPIEPPLPPDDSGSAGSAIQTYISEVRIGDLSRCDNSDYDLAKLVEISEELNQCWGGTCQRQWDTLRD